MAAWRRTGAFGRLVYLGRLPGLEPVVAPVACQLAALLGLVADAVAEVTRYKTYESLQSPTPDHTDGRA